MGQHFKVIEDTRLLRMAVSLSKEPEPYMGWARIGEGFGTRLVGELLSRCGTPGRVLDPFAGTGTTLIASAERGWRGVGIELMPLGPAEFEWVRSWKHVDIEDLASLAELLREEGCRCSEPYLVPYRVAKMLTPGDLEQAIALKNFIDRISSAPERSLYQAAGLLALRDQTRDFEPVLRTARGGRWKTRAGKRAKYDCLENAFGMRLFKMTLALIDAQERGAFPDLGGQQMLQGDAGKVLRGFDPSGFDACITSPPYFNGFDYVEEYLIDHWFLGLDTDLLKAADRLVPTRQEEVPELMAEEDVAFHRYLEMQSDVLTGVARAMRPGAKVFYIIDDAMVDGDDVHLGDDLARSADQVGLEPVAEHRYSKKRNNEASALRLERERTAIYEWKKV